MHLLFEIAFFSEVCVCVCTHTCYKLHSHDIKHVSYVVKPNEANLLIGVVLITKHVMTEKQPNKAMLAL